jgi:type IV pilus assembly protein PilB
VNAAAPPARRRRLGELLIDAGVLDESRLKAALAEQKKWGGKLGRCLVELGFVDEDSMMRALSRQLNLQAIELDTAQLPSTVTQLLRVDLCERYGIFPIGGDSKTRTLQLATSDPTNAEANQELSVATNSRIVLTVATGSAIDRAIRRYYYGEAAGSPRPAGAGPRLAPPSAPGPVVAAPPPPSASLDLDELLGNAPLRPTNPKQPAIAAPAASVDESALKKEVVMLKEQIDALEKVTASQVRALRGLLELLIESGLVLRDDYLGKVHKPD